MACKRVQQRVAPVPRRPPGSIGPRMSAHVVVALLRIYFMLDYGVPVDEPSGRPRDRPGIVYQS